MNFGVAFLVPREGFKKCTEVCLSLCGRFPDHPLQQWNRSSPTFLSQKLFAHLKFMKLFSPMKSLKIASKIKPKCISLDLKQRNRPLPSHIRKRYIQQCLNKITESREGCFSLKRASTSQEKGHITFEISLFRENIFIILISFSL